MRRWLMLIPLAIFLAMAGFLYKGLYLDPTELPSAMIGKPFPAFSLPSVDGGTPLTRPTSRANRRWSTCGPRGAFRAASSTRC